MGLEYKCRVEEFVNLSITKTDRQTTGGLGENRLIGRSLYPERDSNCQKQTKQINKLLCLMTVILQNISFQIGDPSRTGLLVPQLVVVAPDLQIAPVY